MANETKIDSLIIDVDYSAGQASTGLQNLTKTLQSLQSSISPSLSGHGFIERTKLFLFAVPADLLLFGNVFKNVHICCFPLLVVYVTVVSR